MRQPTRSEESYSLLFNSFAMAPGSHARQSPCVYLLIDSIGEQDELAGPQSLAKRSNARSNEAPTKAPTSLEAPTSPLVPPFAKDLFTIFMKVFIEITQAQDQKQLDPREHPLKARTLDIYFEKSYIDYYYF